MSRFLDTRRILVPVDFSESGQSILDYALDVARDRGAEVRLLHVIGIPSGPLDPAYGVTATPQMMLEIQGIAEKRLHEIADAVKGPKVSVTLCTGSPSREIVREAKDWNADLIVIGTHGRTGLRHVFLGSVAENVVRLAPCPVITHRVKGFEIEKV
jgi:nucleotide-binding universal stress UspA family protein